MFGRSTPVPSGPSRRRRGIGAVVAVATLLAGAPTTAAAQTAPATDGTSPATAAASCWEIKQVTPNAPSGVYWLRTPALVAPQQFHCDQTTDGGGWVLIGRGREGWQTRYDGVGAPDQVHTPNTGQAAFQVRQLPATTVDALLDGGRVDALADPIRLRRATNTAGTQWQESRFRFLTRDRWVWTLAAEHRAGSWNIGGTSGSGGQTNNFGTGNGLTRIQTNKVAAQDWTHGFAFGNNITGTTSASSYLWGASSSAGAARPFSQLFLRPRLRTANLSYPAIPDTGAPAIEQSWLPESRAVPSTWGVTGLANGRTGELNEEVQAFTQIGDVMFVGGNFRDVQNGANGAPTRQSYLAAFDVRTGAWIDTFRPTFNQQVKALAALPGGRLAVGGEFTQANGATANGLVVLDPATGATVSGFPVDVENRLTSGVLGVRSLSVQDGWLYLGGNFTHVGGGTRPNHTYARAAARISVTDGTPDQNWNPAFNGTVTAIDASERGDRLYAAGYFSSSNSQPAYRSAIVSTAAGAPLDPTPWNPTYSAGDRQNYQQAIVESGDRLWIGGAEHSTFSYDRTSLQRLTGNITKEGGDFQTLSTANGVVFGGCHCDDWNYSNAYTWSGVGTNWTQADKIGWVAAWDAGTGAVIPDFNPVMRARRGLGAWASHTDTNGTLWIGGDFVSALRTGEITQWVGGFARFAGRDTSAPTTPTGATATTAGATTTVAWNAASDDRAVTGYEVLRGDRVVAVTTDRTVSVPAGPAGSRFFVRAVDAAGNRSATTVLLSGTPGGGDPGEGPGPDPSLPSVPTTASWSWRFQQGDLAADWREPSFDASSWRTGAAPLGFNAASVATDIDVAGGVANRPLSAQFRREFEVADADDIATMQLTTYADDGVAVFVNGTEVGRRNLPSGTLTLGTYATAAPRTAAASSDLVTFTVPGALLVDGTNVIAAQTHLNYRSTPDLSFQLSATSTAVDPDAEPPATPTVTAAATGTTSVEVSWSHDTGAGVVGYRVTRDGGDPTYVQAPTASFTDEGLEPGTGYTYAVVAVDAAGATSAPGTATVTTAAAPDAPVVEAGATWRWRFAQGTVPDGWRDPGFADGGWSSGAAPLGFGSTAIATDIDVSGGAANRPLSALFRRTVEIDDLDGIGALELTTYADDGVAVHVNGTEVGRTNLPAGALTLGSYATAAPRTAAARGAAVTYTVPRSLLVEGANTIAAQVHVNYRSTPDLSFQLSAVTVAADPDADPPAAPQSLTATAAGPTSIALAWSHPDPSDVAAYRISRGGEALATVVAPATSYRDTDLLPATGYDYEVVAVDAAGNASAAAAASATTAAAPAQPIVARGDQWRWRFAQGAVADGWREPGFDDAGWSQGAAPLGFGSATIATDIDVSGGAANRPLSALLRRTVDIEDPDALGELTLTTAADDGVVVFVNGVEVGRRNLPAGPLTLNSYATGAPRTATANANPVTWTVPASALAIGTNVISAQVHVNYRSTPDLSFDLSLTPSDG